MPFALWDATGFVKRYFREPGSETVVAIFEGARSAGNILPVLGYTETYATLRRQFKGGWLSHNEYTTIRSALEREVFDESDLDLLTITDDTILRSLELIDRHNLGTSDAAILCAFLDFQRSLSPPAPSCVLIASNRRLLRAAATEGLSILDPETVPAEDVPRFLSAL